MMKKSALLLIFLLPLWCIDGSINDVAKHECNREILSSILEKELACCTLESPISQANFLSARICEIAQQLLKEGFLVEAYGVNESSPRSFGYFVLWEGEKNRNEAIPLTFFVYVWPLGEACATSIHSHPISCAFAVLHGVCVEKIFEPVENKRVRCINLKKFQIGQGEIDDSKEGFIHQLYGENSPSNLCISLHAYGLHSENQVMDCFRSTFQECTYHE
jgi:hypothetical protein